VNKKNRTGNRGIALILVILMIGVLVAITIELNRSTRSDIHEAANLSDGIKLLYIAKSGFDAGAALLLADRQPYDALTADWGNVRLIEEKSKLLFPDGSFTVPIEDEAGKINVNRLAEGNAYNPDIRDLLIRLLKLPEFNLDSRKIEEIADAIKDWIDPDEELTGAGAESSHYQALDRPYSAKNGPLDCIEELLMIRGMTDRLYYGTKETPGLRQLLTVHGDGKINLNTAPKLVLRSLSPDMTAELADRMDEYRKNREHDLSSAAWYQKIPDMANVSIESRLVTTRSNYFRIVSTGTLNRMTRTVSGVIRRGPDRTTYKLLSWKADE
jgi:general secretion pathway protein K